MVIIVAYNISGDTGSPRCKFDNWATALKQGMERYLINYPSTLTVKENHNSLQYKQKLRVCKLNALNTYMGFEEISS